MRSYAIRATPHNCSRITTVETICIPTMQAAAPRGMRFLSHCSKAIKLDSTDAEGRLTLGVRPRIPSGRQPFHNRIGEGLPVIRPEPEGLPRPKANRALVQRWLPTR